jgi:hypothetical protein
MSGTPEVVQGNAESYQWAYSIMDSSRVSTFFISILLIVYGSFRSLALEEDSKEGLSKFGHMFIRFYPVL